MKTSTTVEVIEREYKILGFTEEVTDCGCCGRTGLKGTLVLEHLGSGDINHFGIVCGAKIANNTKKHMEILLTEVEKENIAKASLEFNATAEKKEYDQYMIDREALFTREQSYEERLPIIQKTMELSNKADLVRKEICNKYFIKYKHKVN